MESDWVTYHRWTEEELLAEAEALPDNWEVDMLRSQREFMARLGDEIRRRNPFYSYYPEIPSDYARQCVRDYISKHWKRFQEEEEPIVLLAGIEPA